MKHETTAKIPIKILSLEDSPLDTERIVDALMEAGYDLKMDSTEKKEEFASFLHSHTHDVILSDFNLPGFDAFGALKVSLEICPEIPFICVSGSIGEETAIDLIKQGADDYVMKDRLERLPFAVQRSLDKARERKLRQQVEETLRQSEERYRTLFTFLPDALYVHVNGRITLVNPALCRMLGTDDPSQLIGKSALDIIHPDYHGPAQKRWNLALAGQPAAILQEQFIRLGGSVVDVEVSSVGVDWQGSKGVQVIARDITDRKRAEQAVHESEERFRMVFENVFDGISLYIEDPDPSKRKLVECNERYAAMAGRSREELLRSGNTQELQITRDDMANRNRLESLVGGVAYRGSFSWVRPDKKENFVEYVAKPIIWRGQSYSIGIDRDVSERKQAEETQLLLTMALESTANGVVITDVKGNIVWVNNAFTQMTGYSQTEARGQNPRILNSGKQNIAFYRSLWDTITAGHEWHDELVNRKKDGTLYPEEMTITPLKAMKGEITHFIAVKQDITDRKNGERNIRLLAQTVATARDCISVTGLDNRFVFVNDAFCHTYGYAAEDLIGKDVSILRSPHSPSAVTDQILPGTLKGGWHGEILNRRQDGSDFTMELWTSIVRNESGDPVAMVGVGRDITERKSAEEHLRQSEEQFRSIAENVGDMIAVLDLGGRRIYASRSDKNFFGDPELLKGAEWSGAIHPEDRERVKQVLQETIRTGVGQRIEYRFLSNDGSVRDVDSKGNVIRDRDGKISQVIMVSRDVTEEKKLLAQFLRAQRMESIGTLAGGIAHDLNNILAPIMMAIHILRSKTSDPQTQRILDTMDSSAKRGSDIVKQVLAFGRGITGDRILMQLANIVDEVVKIAGQTFPKSISIETTIPKDLWTVSADPTQMHQVLLNMVVNARDAMRTGGTLSLSAANVHLDEHYSRMHLEAKPGEYVSIMIIDTGSGIPLGIRDKIFEPFFTTKEIGSGTGLGLSTSLAIVKSHGGFINLESEPGKGTTFSVYIPATRSASRIEPPSANLDFPTGNGELILIIDDEAAIREITSETLQAYGYKAVTAVNGVDGVAIFAEHKKDIKVVITDIVMPVMDGTDAIRILSQLDPDVKIIAASGLTTKVQTMPQSISNVKVFLTKPYTAETLLKALATVLR